MTFRSLPGRRPFLRSSLRLAVLAGALACAAWAAPAPAAAQVDSAIAAVDTIREIRLRDGSVIYGRIESDAGERLVIVTTAGARVEVDRAQVRSVSVVRGTFRGGEMWPEDPNRTRLFFAPTGRSLAAGDGYFGSFEAIFPFVSYGVTDRFTLSGGIPILPDAIGELAYLAPKLQLVSAEGVDVSVGAFGFLTTEALGSAGLLYGVATLGSEDRAVTVGGGVPFLVTDEDSDVFTETGLLMAGGEYRVSPRVKLLSENYFSTDFNGAIYSFGVRIIGDRLSGDIGLAGITDDDGDGGCCLPVVNFVYNFRRSRRE